MPTQPCVACTGPASHAAHTRARPLGYASAPVYGLGCAQPAKRGLCSLGPIPAPTLRVHDNRACGQRVCQDRAPRKTRKAVWALHSSARRAARGFAAAAWRQTASPPAATKAFTNPRAPGAAESPAALTLQTSSKCARNNRLLRGRSYSASQPHA